MHKKCAEKGGNMTKEEFKSLERGDVVKHADEREVVRKHEIKYG